MQLEFWNKYYPFIIHRKSISFLFSNKSLCNSSIISTFSQWHRKRHIIFTILLGLGYIKTFILYKNTGITKQNCSYHNVYHNNAQIGLSERDVRRFNILLCYVLYVTSIIMSPVYNYTTFIPFCLWNFVIKFSFLKCA